MVPHPLYAGAPAFHGVALLAPRSELAAVDVGVAIGAAANHCAFYPMSSTIVGQFQAELKTYDTSKGAIRFQPEKPLPAALVRKLVKARIAETSAP